MNNNRVKTFREKFHIPGKLALSLNKLLGRENINDDECKLGDGGDEKPSRFSRFANSIKKFANTDKNSEFSLALNSLA